VPEGKFRNLNGNKEVFVCYFYYLQAIAPLCVIYYASLNFVQVASFEANCNSVASSQSIPETLASLEMQGVCNHVTYQAT
jgi:hypothetical protein